jgi:DNA polymerase-4
MDRVIFLVDMNAFFISCEMARNPELKGKPAAVAGDPKKRSGIILAANYDARRYGVKTTMVLHEAKKLCPQLILVPPDHDLYSSKSREVMKILRQYSPVVQQNSIDEAWMDLTGCEKLLGKPYDIAKRIMQQIMDELDLWCSIGISENKFLAKMASERKKPLGITEVWIKDVKEIMWPLRVSEMYGIGKQTEAKLAKLSVFTIGDLANAGKEMLSLHFGKYGEELRNLANGIDHSQVTELPHHESKSISRSTTLPRDTKNLDYAKRVLFNLSEEVGTEARKSGFKGKTVSIVIKYSDFSSITRQRSISPTYLTKDIYNAGIMLLSDNWSSKSVRLLGIGLGNIEEKQFEQVSLFDLGADYSKDSKSREEDLEKAIDNIRGKYGSNIIKRAKVLHEPEEY